MGRLMQTDKTNNPIIDFYIRSKEKNLTNEDKANIRLVTGWILSCILHVPLFIHFKYYSSSSAYNRGISSSPLKISIQNPPFNPSIAETLLDDLHLDSNHASQVEDLYSASKQASQVIAEKRYIESDALDNPPKISGSFELLSRANPISGNTILKIKLWINAAGSVDDYEIIFTSISDDEIGDIIRQIKRAKFTPGVKDGIYVGTTIIGEFESIN